MKKLELPITIRTPRLDEVPQDPEIADAILSAQKANIVEGYVFKTDIPPDSLFTFFAEINIDNSKLWKLVTSLLMLLPENVSFMFGHIDNELHFSNYYNIKSILENIAALENELVQDGLLEFGFIYQDEEILSEVFIKNAKYIQFWGVMPAPFLDLMAQFNLTEIEELNFIDEYPMVTESLSHLLPERMGTDETLNKLKNIFI